MALVMPDMTKLHPGLKALIALLPAIIIAIPFYLLVYSPATELISKLTTELTKLNDEIATAEKKAAKLPSLKVQQKLAEEEYNKVRRHLPEENEITNLLKQVSDNAIKSGLTVILWEPQPRKNHSSNILYEIPVRVQVKGSYHKLGDFLSSLTALDRIVNTSKIDLGNPTPNGDEALLSISLEERTFSAIPDEKQGKAPGK
ncbi:MAG: type 4a pilus biogenesis protein PilO [Nitrospirae bacterium]|nr:type 4a pilus biogenesis protein PilO [Nitrospirota bacterium]